MKRVSLIILAAFAVFSCTRVEEQAAPSQEPVSGNEQVSPFAPGQMIVEFDDSMLAQLESGDALVATRAMGGCFDELGIESLERVFPDAGEYEERTRREGLHRFYSVTFRSDVAVTKASASLESMPGILSAQPVRNYRKRAIFNDPQFSKQWHYINKSNEDADINVEEVWEKYTKGRSDVIVCVVDEPIDPTHPDLQANLWKDSDGHTGYNFARSSWDLSIRPENGNGDIGHGTHVAGTIAAVNNNGTGVCGIAGGDYANGIPGVLLQSCAIFSGSSGCTDGQTANAIKWGADHGALISQNSWGSYADVNEDGYVSASELAAFKNETIPGVIQAAIDYFIKYAGCDNKGNQKPDSPMKGGLVIFAAGNENIDYDPICDYAPVIAVGAFGPNGSKASYSNYGNWVDLGAPGGEGTSSGNSVWSTVPTKVTSSGYSGTGWAGTSMACPHVSGVAALIISYFGHSGFTADDCREFLMEGATDNFFSGSKRIGRKVDALGSFLYGLGQLGAVQILVSGTIPAQIHQHQTISVEVTATSTDGSAVTLSLKNAPRGVSLSGSTLTINGPESATGLQAFTIEGNAAGGASGSLEIRYTMLPNHAPTVTEGIQNQLLGSFSKKTIDLTQHFSDEDGETLTYTVVTVSDPEVLDVKVSGGNLVITPLQYGDCFVEVMATDALGLKAKTSFNSVVYDPSKPVSVYPLQVEDNLNIRINSQTMADTKITIISTSGSVIFDAGRYLNLFNPTSIDMKGCAPGIYTATITFNGKTNRVKVVKL